MRKPHTAIVVCILLTLGWIPDVFANKAISVEPSYVFLDEKPETIRLTSSAQIFDGRAYTIYINSHEFEHTQVEANTFDITIHPGELLPGNCNVTIKSGVNTLIVVRAFTLLKTPRFYKGITPLPQTDEAIDVNRGETLSVEIPGAPVDELEIEIEGEPAATAVLGKKAKVAVPERGPDRTTNLIIRWEGAKLYQRSLNIVRFRPTIDTIVGAYSTDYPKGMWLRIDSDAPDPRAITVVARCPSSSDSLFSYGSKSSSPGHIYYCKYKRLTPYEVCTFIVRHHGQKIWKYDGRVVNDRGKKTIKLSNRRDFAARTSTAQAHTPQPPVVQPPPVRPPVVRSADKNLTETLSRLVEDVAAGDIRVRDISFSFGTVRGGGDPYYIGLTKEQRAVPSLNAMNLAQSSSTMRGAVKIRLAQPFLIQMTEVSNEQYLPFLRKSRANARVPTHLKPYSSGGRLPRKLAEHPITDISYLDARAYANWLQEDLRRLAPGWIIRLPHELEWEIAARKDKEPYTFPIQDMDKGLESIGVSTIRSVGTNPYDKSWMGVKDLCGNVSEWTETVYTSNLLVLLGAMAMQGESFSWTPADPYSFKGIPRLKEDAMNRSHNMCVRGGANGEDPLLQQVSIRRMREFKTRDAKIGFRLVITEKK